MVEVGGGRLSKNVSHHGWPTTKNLKKDTGWNGLKQSQKTKFDRNINYSKCHIWIFFFWILFRAYNFFILVQKFQWKSSEFLFNFRFSSRKSQSQQKVANEITYFTIRFHSKNLAHFMNLNPLDIENNMLPQ